MSDTRPSKSGSRWKDDAVVPDEWITWAMEKEGLSIDAAKRQADIFVDYWISVAGASARKANWFATWRNWIRRCNEGRCFSSASPAGGPGRERPRGGGMLGAALRAVGKDSSGES